ncbi:MAG: DNA-3-methyladenine glycosylase I [Methylophilaceae bacterium]|nr:MAG: DNA-3-methyladenine glycosylase I [Methylophilaceae bacterium]
MLMNQTTMSRCEWAHGSALLIQYHDAEWGVPVHDDRLLFEALTLEGAQAGLSWATILNKREGYRQAFDDFDIQTVALYSAEKVESLLQNPAIIRNKLKVNATVINAQRILAVQSEYGSFDAFIWSFVDGKPINNQWQQHSDIPATSVLSDWMSKTLKNHGFQFIGSTTCYAFMQAVGMVNDHTKNCFRHDRQQAL